MRRSLPMKIREFFDANRKNQYAIKPYLVRDGKKHPVAVICPGGGYRRVCSFIEGHPFAKKLNKMGYHAVVVYYRVRELAAFPNPQDDLARAVKELYQYANDWNLDLNCYSVWGSSAGGHLAASFGTESIGWKKYGLPKPGAMILIYPVITMDKKTHTGSRNYHIGSSPSQDIIDKTSIENLITPEYPPTYLWWGNQDSTVHPDNSRGMMAALKENQIPTVYREYPDTGHGVGIGKGLPCEGWFEEAVSFWQKQIDGS